jgi:hypothetical protein
MNHEIKVESIHINLSPHGFRRVAEDMIRCADNCNFGRLSLVPYFLYCRAIELGLKAKHLEQTTQSEVKNRFAHDLLASYNALPDTAKTLSAADAELLAKVTPLYIRKAFEYMQRCRLTSA